MKNFVRKTRRVSGSWSTGQRVAGVAMSALLALTLAGCGEDAVSADADATGELSIGDSTQTPDQLPVYIAADHGMFEKQGLNVHIVKMNTGGSATAAMASGAIPINGGAPTSIISAVSEGAIHARGFYGLNMRFSYDLVTTPAINSVADLKGKKIALSSPGGSADIAGRSYLASEGIDVGTEMTPLNVGNTGDRIAAISTGQIDASLIPSGSREHAESAGCKVLVKSEDIALALPLMAMNVVTEFAEKNPETVRKVVAALDEAVAFLRDPANKEAILKILSERLGYNEADSEASYAYYTRDLPGFYQVGGELSEDAYSELLDAMGKLDPKVENLTLDDVLTTEFLKK